VAFTDPSALDLSRTLARQLIPTADLLRDLRTRFGMRPYSVHVVRTRWSGGARGEGVETVVSDLVILPTPRIVDLSSLSVVVQSAGADELGSVQLDEISGRFTDEQLQGRHDDGSPPNLDEQVFYEVFFPQFSAATRGGVLPITLPATLGGPPVVAPRRRFSPVSAPHYTAGRFEWVIRLERARPDRGSAGELF
jgi:hypothetical protein